MYYVLHSRSPTTGKKNEFFTPYLLGFEWKIHGAVHDQIETAIRKFIRLYNFSVFVQYQKQIFQIIWVNFIILA